MAATTTNTTTTDTTPTATSDDVTAHSPPVTTPVAVAEPTTAPSSDASSTSSTAATTEPATTEPAPAPARESSSSSTASDAPADTSLAATIIKTLAALSSSTSSDPDSPHALVTLAALLLRQPDDDLRSTVEQLLGSKAANDAVAMHIASGAFGSAHDVLCHWLFELYNSNNAHLVRYVLCFVPNIVWQYTTHNAVHSCLPGAEALLIAMYRRASVAAAAAPERQCFRPPHLHRSSTLHTSTLSQSARVGKREKGSDSSQMAPQQVAVPLKTPAPLEDIGAPVRAQLVELALAEYVGEIRFMTAASHADFIDLCKRLASSGIELASTAPMSMPALSAPSTPRGHVQFNVSARPIYLPEAAWQYCVTGLGHLVFQESTKAAAVRAARTLRERAQAELDASLLLSTNALLHASKFQAKSH